MPRRIVLIQGHPDPAPERFDWLVPGLRSAKLEALIRTLPQHLRRQVMPAAEYARALDERLKPDDGALLPAMCEALQQMTGVRLTADDFATDKLDAYLLPRLQLEDDKGKLLGVANTLDGLHVFADNGTVIGNAQDFWGSVPVVWIRGAET